MSEEALDSRINTTESTRDRLVRAMVEVVGEDGLAAASVRTIARRAGCNEAVLYQHFPSKLAMQQAIYEEIVKAMAEAKQRIAESAGSVAEMVRQWMLETYEFYDRNPAAFAYVYLSFPALPLSDPAIADENSRIFLAGLNRLDPDLRKDLDSRPTDVAMAKGLLLAIPMQIHEDELEGPAASHAATVAEMIIKVLSPADD